MKQFISGLLLLFFTQLSFAEYVQTNVKINGRGPVTLAADEAPAGRNAVMFYNIMLSFQGRGYAISSKSDKESVEQMGHLLCRQVSKKYSTPTVLSDYQFGYGPTGSGSLLLEQQAGNTIKAKLDSIKEQMVSVTCTNK